MSIGGNFFIILNYLCKWAISSNTTSRPKSSFSGYAIWFDVLLSIFRSTNLTGAGIDSTQERHLRYQHQKLSNWSFCGQILELSLPRSWLKSSPSSTEHGQDIRTTCDKSAEVEVSVKTCHMAGNDIGKTNLSWLSCTPLIFQGSWRNSLGSSMFESHHNPPFFGCQRRRD